MKRLVVMVALAMFLFVSCDVIKTMTFDFQKDSSIVDPHIAIYDEDGYEQENSTVMFNDNGSIEILCWEGERYCWGAWTEDDEWGCGKNCNTDNDAACHFCKDGYVTVRLKSETL